MLATAVIVISLVVQGLTLEPLVRLAGIARADSARHEETVARLYNDGTISQPTRLRLQHGLDLEAARLSDEHH